MSYFSVAFELANERYALGRQRGLVELLALGGGGNETVVTVLAPLPDEIQGWSSGLKLSIRQPFAAARSVSSTLLWRLIELTRAYRRSQNREFIVQARSQTPAGDILGGA